MAATLPSMIKHAQTGGQNTPGAGAPTMGLFSALAKAKKQSTTGLPMVADENSPSKNILKNLAAIGGEGNGGNKLEYMMNVGLKKRMGMDYISERSGLDMRKFTAEYIHHKLEKYKSKTKKTVMTRADLIEFAETEYNLVITMLSATDGILFCRGPQLDHSETYNEDKLIHWLGASLPGMRKTTDKFEPKKTHARSMTNSQDNFYLFKMSGVGKLNYQTSRPSYGQPHISDQEKTLQQMNECLKECEKVPSLKRKVQETLSSLEQSMMDYRAQRGLEASVRARHRLRDKANKEEESKEKSVQIMLEQTAVLDSPIRAANLQEVLKKQWCEYKDSYVIMSKLTKRQKQKLNDMIFNRYNDV